MKGRPKLIELVVIDAQRSRTQVLIGMDDRLKAMTMHAATLMPDGDIRQLMRRLEPKSPPYMGMSSTVYIHALKCSALDGNAINAWGIQMGTDPSCEILVGWFVQQKVQMGVVEGRNTCLQACAKRLYVAPWIGGPIWRQLRKDRRLEAVAV